MTKTNSVFWPSVGLLLKKNFILRKRQYVVTLFEIILPALLAILLAVFNTWTPPTPPQQDNPVYKHDEFSEMDLVKELQQWTRARRWPGKKTFILGYAPSNNFTDEIMQNFRTILAKFKMPLKHETRAFTSEQAIIDLNGRNVFGNTDDSITEILRAAIIFEDGFQRSKADFLNDPHAQKLAYKIRIVDKVKEKDYPTSETYPYVKYPGPGILSASQGYKLGGFTSIQVFLDKVIIGVVTNKTVEHTIGVQAFPYPSYKAELDFSNLFIPVLPLLLVFGFIFIVPSTLRNVVSEKESGIKELMKMMGLRSYLHWLGWMLDSLLILVVPVTVVVCVLFVPFVSKGGFLQHSNPFLWWIIFFLFGISTVSALFLMSTFFQSPPMAIAVGVVFWIVSYFAMLVPLQNNYEWLSLSEKMLSCLAPHMAFHWAIKIMFTFERKGIGATWTNVGQPLNSLDNFTVGHVILMNILSTCIYMILTLYFEAVLPSQHGINKPWNFIFKKSFWRQFVNGKDNSNSLYNEVRISVAGNSDTSSTNGFEEEPCDTDARVKIQNLKKRFGQKLAVDGLSLNLYDGQITALLGCNGVGKTTLINILTGRIKPTEGTAAIGGYSIDKEMTFIRKQLGFCPQHNVLFEKLTVNENLDFFGRLKGLKRAGIQNESTNLLEKLQLKEKRFSLAGNLSGGQKRKLCLGMAIIGGSKVVVLDEPTAGMDPEARRSIWDLLLEVKQSRTVLLTTHFMEEADILGDRVAIMASGKIHCCGSPLFLKRYYGSGCTLKMTIRAPLKSNRAAILDLVKTHAPEAYLQDNKESPSAENPESTDAQTRDISIILPRTNGINDTSKFPALFAELTKQKNDLGILDIGLPLTTLDDIFTKVAEETIQKEDNQNNLVVINDLNTTVKNIEENNFNFEIGESEKPTTNAFLMRARQISHPYIQQVFKIALQFKGLLAKRYLYTLRHKRLFAAQMLLPLLIIVSSVIIFNRQNAPLPPRPPLRMTLNHYKDPKVVYGSTNETQSEELGRIFQSLVAQTPESVNAKVLQVPQNEEIHDFLVQQGISDEDQYRERFVFSADFKENYHVVAMFQTIPFHASPLAVNFVSNTILKFLHNPNGTRKDITILTTNHPMKGGINTLLDSATQNKNAPKNLPLIFALLMPLGLSTLAASFIVFPLEERISQAKSLQMMTGLNTLVFWSASFAWDFLLVLILATVAIPFFPILQTYSAFTTGEALSTFFFIMISFGMAAISFAYLMSLVMSSIAGGFALITITGIITGTMGVLVVHILEQCNFFSVANTMRSVCRIFPTFSASLSLMRFVDKVTRNVKCNMASKELKDIVCDPDASFDPKLEVEDFQRCCDSCADPKFYEKGIACFKLNPLLEWKGPSESDHIPKEIILPGILQEIFFMFICFLGFKILLFLIEITKPYFPLILEKIHSISLRKFQTEVTNDATIDKDVLEEKGRVENVIKKGATSLEAIVVHELRKEFGKFRAVSQVTFGVHKGECFGLLGINGAGKTTLFKMMTGNLAPTMGNAWIDPYQLRSQPKNYSRQIGYCPQYDGLIGCLTGEETLRLFCSLRGIPSKNIDMETQNWLGQLGLLSSAKVKCENYSGGMKRRLSVAISMIGHPPLLMLDEPTSGVDPVSRRQFWQLVTSGKSKGQSLILTSHSMEECEALCSRLGIMVRGQLECLGGIQHLKTRFAKGFTITVKLNQRLTPEERDAKQREICTEIGGQLGSCVLKEQHKNVMEYHVRTDETIMVDWGAVFSLVEGIKCRNADSVDDYSVNEITLEEIFMSIARSKGKPARNEQLILKQNETKLEI